MPPETNSYVITQVCSQTNRCIVLNLTIKALKQGQVLLISFSIPFSPCVKVTLTNGEGNSTRLFYNDVSSGQCGV